MPSFRSGDDNLWIFLTFPPCFRTTIPLAALLNLPPRPLHGVALLRSSLGQAVYLRLDWRTTTCLILPALQPRFRTIIPLAALLNLPPPPPSRGGLAALEPWSSCLPSFGSADDNLLILPMVLP